MVEELTEIINELRRISLKNKSIARNDDSRREKLYEYIEDTSGGEIKIEKPVFIEIDREYSLRTYSNIYGVDSSSRVIDTPYIFIAVGASTIVNRYRGFVIDYPSIDQIFRNNTKHDYIVVIPEITGSLDSLVELLEEKGFITCNPIGFRYTPRYSKYVVLDELRLMLENKVLEKALELDKISNSYILIDGPIYYTPPLVYQLNEMHGIVDDYIKLYVAGWKKIIEKRINIINRLEKEKDVIVIGVVKRLSRSNILSRIDPLNISSGKFNDEVYLSMITTMKYRSISPKPYVFGPIIYDPGVTPISLPYKKLYYIGIPRRKVIGGTDYRNYMFFRIETITGKDSIIEPIIYDSIYAGSVIPLSILIADKRVKKITNGIVNYLLRMTGLSSENTYQYISF